MNVEGAFVILDLDLNKVWIMLASIGDSMIWLCPSGKIEVGTQRSLKDLEQDGYKQL